MFVVKPPPGLMGQDYADFCVADDDFLEPLATAHGYVEDALIFIEDNGLDNAEQREYAKAKIESMRYLLDRMLSEHLQEA